MTKLELQQMEQSIEKHIIQVKDHLDAIKEDWEAALFTEILYGLELAHEEIAKRLFVWN